MDNYGQYEYSWKPSQSAYLEPSLWDSFNAPQHTKFMDGGRVTAYSNYAAGLVSGTGIIARTQVPGSGDAEDDIITLDGGVYGFDFSEVGEDSIFQSSYVSQVHTKINVDKEYTFVPYDYFYWYSRDRKPIVKNGVVYDLDYRTGPGVVGYPFIAANTNYSIYAGVSYIVPGAGTINKNAQDDNISTIDSHTKFYDSVSFRYIPVPAIADKKARMSEIQCNNSTNTAKDASKGISNTRLIYDFTNLICPDHGVNCITFTKFTTDRVTLPKLKKDNRDISDLTIRRLYGFSL